MELVVAQERIRDLEEEGQDPPQGGSAGSNLVGDTCMIAI
jgi:hypothetical protein